MVRFEICMISNSRFILFYWVIMPMSFLSTACLSYEEENPLASLPCLSYQRVALLHGLGEVVGRISDQPYQLVCKLKIIPGATIYLLHTSAL